MNAADYARHRGVSKARVSQWIAEGKISVEKIGRGYEIDPEVADLQLGDNLNETLRRGDGRAGSKSEVGAEAVGSGQTLAEAQRLKMVYQAERARLGVLKERGELVVAADVKKEVTALMRTVRDSMLSIPDRVSSQLAAMHDSYEVHQLLDGEIRTALRMLADG